MRLFIHQAFCARVELAKAGEQIRQLSHGARIEFLELGDCVIEFRPERVVFRNPFGLAFCIDIDRALMPLAQTWLQRAQPVGGKRRVFISGQKRGVFGRIKRELTRRSAIEAVIGHMKAEGHLGRCYLKGRAGDAANVILSAVGYNLRLVLAWLRIILRVILLALLQTFTIRPALKPAS
jgi:IS5 family transposase